MKRDIIIMSFATVAAVALLFVTWALIAFSNWIVGHSGVEDWLQRDGEHTLLFLKDTFWFLGRGLLAVEILASIGFLVVLWRRLFQPGARP